MAEIKLDHAFRLPGDPGRDLSGRGNDSGSCLLCRDAVRWPAGGNSKNPLVISSVPCGSFSIPIPVLFAAVYVLPSRLSSARPAAARLDSNKNDSKLIQTTNRSGHQQGVEKHFRGGGCKMKIVEKAQFTEGNEHFETIFNAADTTQVVLQQPARVCSRIVLVTRARSLEQK